MIDAPEIRFRIKTDEYVVRIGEFTPQDAGDFRRATGIPMMQAFGVVDLDIIAAFVWLVRRRAEHDLTFAAVASSFTYADYEPGLGEQAEDDPTSPPA